jgi:hypothetical protein
MRTISVAGDLIGVPDEADDAAIERIAQNHLRSKRQRSAQESARQTFEDVNPIAKLAIGLGASAAEPVMGLKQAALEIAGRPTEGIEEQIATVRGAREAAGGWGTAGEVAGWALGGAAKAPAAITKLLGRALPASTARFAAPVAQEAVMQAAYEGSRGTLEDDPDRLQNAARGALYGAGGGAVGHMLPKALGRVARPLRASDAAQNVVRRARDLGEDIDLSVGQAAGGSVAALEEGLGGAPIIGRLINRAREGAGEQWNRSLLNDVLRTAAPVGPSTARVARSGAEGIEEAQRAVREAYRDALEGRTLSMASDTFDGSLAAISRLPASDADVALKVLDNVAHDIESGNVSGDAITRLRSEIDEYASKAYREGNYPLGRALDAVSADVRRLINQTGDYAKNLRLRQADEAYGRLADINRAAAMQGAVIAGGRFTPSQLINAQRRGEPASMVASQRTAGMKGAVEANEVLGNNFVPKIGPGTAEKAATMAALGLAGSAAGGLIEGDLPGPAWAGAPLAYALLGTRAGRRYLVPELGRGRMSRAQIALAEALRNRAVRGPTRAAAARLALLLEGEERGY